MPLPHADQGPFLSGLDWLHRLGEIPWDIAAGDPEQAGRNALDAAGDVPDAILPGDIIPHVADAHPRHHASEVLGVDRTDHPIASRAIDATLETLTNPLTYLTVDHNAAGKLAAHYGVPFVKSLQHEIGGSADAIETAGKILRKGVEKIPEAITKPLKAAATTARRSLNWLDVPEQGKALIDEAGAANQNTVRAGLAEVERIYKDLTPAEQEAAGEVLHGIARPDQANRATWHEITDATAYLNGRSDIDQAKVIKALQERERLSHMQRVEGLRGGIFTRGIRHNDDTYLARKFTGLREAPGAEPDVMGRPSAISARHEELKTPGGLLKFLQDPAQAKVNLEFNALTADTHRAEQQGRLAEKAVVGNALTAGKVLRGGTFALGDPEHVKMVRQSLSELAKTQPDYAYRLGNVFNGIPSRESMPLGWFAQGLAGANGLFKKAATVGVLVPRVAFNVRNRIGGLWQAISQDETAGTVGHNAKRVLSDLVGAFDDGFAKLSGARLTGGELTQALDGVEQAFRASRGSVTKAMEHVRGLQNGHLLEEALKHHVMDNFITSESLLSHMAKTPARRRLNDIMDWPAEVGKGLEQRMRLGTFLDLRRGGMDAAKAARATKEAYLDYGVSGPANRTFRDVVPFGVFLSQNLKQQAKFLLRHPGVGVAAANVLGSDQGDDQGIKYPWLESQAAIPSGLDEKGNPQYLTGFGLPIEGLSQVPGLDAGQTYHNVVGSLNPLLKTAIAWGADRDPMTGQSFGSYDKNPLTGEHGDTGRYYQMIASTGLLQPVTGPIQQYALATDERTTAAEKILQLGTGAHFVSVDPAVAQREQLEEYVKSRPDIHQATSYYQTDGDPQLQEVLQELAAAKARLRKQRQQAAVSPVLPTQ